jgi:hypothetical protein
MGIQALSHYLPPYLSGFAGWELLVLRLVWGIALVQHGRLKLKHPFDWMDIEAGKHLWFPGFVQATGAMTIFIGGITTSDCACKSNGNCILPAPAQWYFLVKELSDAPGDSYEASSTGLTLFAV